jgi:hypothetical protein
MTRKAQSASDLVADLQVRLEELSDAAKREVRDDIAAELAELVKHSDQLAGFMKVVTEPRTKKQLPAYLPGTPAGWEPSNDFLDGIRFAIAALRDPNFDY